MSLKSEVLKRRETESEDASVQATISIHNETTIALELSPLSITLSDEEAVVFSLLCLNKNHVVSLSELNRALQNFSSKSKVDIVTRIKSIHQQLSEKLAVFESQLMGKIFVIEITETNDLVLNTPAEFSFKSDEYKNPNAPRGTSFAHEDK